MSFVCPKCGYEDSPLWRNRYFDPHAQIMNWDDFQRLYPHLSDTIAWGKVLQEGPYAYKKEGRCVVRLTLPEAKARRNFKRVDLDNGRPSRIPSAYLGVMKKLPERKLQVKEKISSYG